MTTPDVGVPDWQPDPTGRHQYRYWDGSTWTDHVADDGVATSDPFEAASLADDVQPDAQPGPAEADVARRGGASSLAEQDRPGIWPADAGPVEAAGPVQAGPADLTEPVDLDKRSAGPAVAAEPGAESAPSPADEHESPPVTVAADDPTTNPPPVPEPEPPGWSAWEPPPPGQSTWAPPAPFEPPTTVDPPTSVSPVLGAGAAPYPGAPAAPEGPPPAPGDWIGGAPPVGLPPPGPGPDGGMPGGPPPRRRSRAPLVVGAVLVVAALAVAAFLVLGGDDDGAASEGISEIDVTDSPLVRDVSLRAGQVLLVTLTPIDDGFDPRLGIALDVDSQGAEALENVIDDQLSSDGNGFSDGLDAEAGTVVSVADDGNEGEAERNFFPALDDLDVAVVVEGVDRTEGRATLELEVLDVADLGSVRDNDELFELLCADRDFRVHDSRAFEACALFSSDPASS